MILLKIAKTNADDTEHQPLVNNPEQALSVFEMIKSRDVWFPFVLCILNLVGQQAGAMKIIQGFQVEIFAEVYTNRSLKTTATPASNSSFNYWASVFLGIIRLVAALVAAKYIKNFG